MDFVGSSEKSTNAAELIVFPFWEGKDGAENAVSLKKYKGYIQTSAIKKDFKAKEGEIFFVYGDPGFHQPIALIGLGLKEKITLEKLRRCYAQLAKACHPKKIEEILLFLPHITQLDEKAVVEGITEGLLLSNYTFSLKSIKKSETVLIKKVSLVGVSKPGLDAAKRCVVIAEGVYMARDLVNGNADDVTPQYLSQFAKDLARKLPIKTTVLNKKQIEKEKMGLLLAVNRGSTRDPALIMMTYKGLPRSKENIVLVGKGITYDTGGLNLKPTASMETMKADMGGAAAVIGTLFAAAKLRLKVNLTVVVPASENSIGPDSFKPGDVYKSYKGTTIENTNPDAEGRLVLADAISYAKKKLKPSCIIDLATLTGGIEIALGSEACGLYSNDENLVQVIQEAAKSTGERVWRMPLYEEYRDHLKSDIADMKNSGGRSASSNTAAIFLQEFVEDTPWIHLDIASVAYLSDKKRYHPKYGTGFGVRLLIDFLSLFKSS